MPIEEGKAAPAFTLTNQEGEKVALKDFRGQNVIVWHSNTIRGGPSTGGDAAQLYGVRATGSATSQTSGETPPPASAGVHLTS